MSGGADLQSRADGVCKARLVWIAVLAGAGLQAEAQPWVPPAGAGSVTIAYQRIANAGHRLTDGKLVEGGQSVNMALYVEAEYALTNRLTFTLGLPFVMSRYTDSRPPPPPFPYLPLDQCHCWQSGWQDFGFTARYNLLGGSLAFTPFISAGVPSHNYNYRGEAVLGRNLREVRLGIDAGRRLSAISENLSLQGRYSYAFVQRVLDVPNNRSNMLLESVYVVRGKLAMQGFSAWQRTHGGLRSGSIPPAELVFPGDINTPEYLAEHDRLLRDNNWRLGGGIAYSFERMDVFDNYTAYMRGTDTHAGGAITVGISVPFQTFGLHR